MEDPERSTLSSLDLYSDMIGETEDGEMEEMSAGGRGQADLYSDMIEGTEELNEREGGQADLYTDMLGETEGMTEGGRGQMDLYSDMLGETEEMSERGRGQVEEHSVMSSMDLYEDIIEEERENEKFEELRSEVTKTAGQMEDLMAQMEHVQTEKQSLAAENRALKKNISVLFVTAKSELDRKQKEIAQLRADLDMLRMRRGAPRIPHSTRPFDNRGDHSRPGPSGRESTITREASSTHRDMADRQTGSYRQNNQQGESPERDRSRREGAGVSKSHPEQRNFRCSQSPEKDQDRRDGTRDRTCNIKHTNSELKTRETKQQTGDKTDSVHHTDRSAGEGSMPRQANQDRDKRKTKDTEEIKDKDGKAVERGQERSKSSGERTGPHTPTYPYPDSEQEATVGQASLKEPVPGGPKTPPEPYPYEDAADSRKLRNDSERHHEQEGGRHKVTGDDIKNKKHSKERQKDSAYHSSGSKSLRGCENSIEDRREEHKQEGYRNKMARHDEGRGHSGEGKKDSAYCSSGSESLGRHSRESSSEKKREEYEKDKRRGEDSRLDSKTRKGPRHASREKHQKDGQNSHEKSSQHKRMEHEPDRRRENNISSGDLRQKLSQKKRSRDRSKEKSSDDSKQGDHDKRKAVEQKEPNSRKIKDSRHGKEPSSRITERGRERHRDEGRSTERDRSNSRLQREGRRKGDKSERSQLPGDTREAQKRKRSSSGEHRHLKERRKVSPPRKKQYEKDRDGHEKSKERKQSSSRHKDRSEGRKKERSRHRSRERSNSLHGNSKEPDTRGHRSKFVNYRDRSEDRDSDPDSQRSQSVETDSSLGSSSAGSTADVQKHLPTSFEGSLHSSRSREAGQQDRVAALTSPVRGNSLKEEPIEADTVEERTDALDEQDTALKSHKHYKDSDELKEKTDHPTSPYRGKSDREKTIQKSPDCATEAGSSQKPVTTGHQLQEKHDESDMEEEVTSTTTEQPDRGADVRVRVDSDSCAEELGSILAPVKRKREDATQGHVTSPVAKKKKAAQNTPTKKGRLSPRKNVKRSPSKKGMCSPKKSPKKIPQEVAESEITPNTLVSPQKTPKKLVKSPQTSPKKVTMSPQDTSKKVFKSPQKTPKKSSATPKKKSKSPRKTENLVEKCRSIVWTGKSAKGKTVNLFHIEYETAENAAREVFRNSPLLSPVKPPTPQLNLSARSSDLELPSGEESCSLPLPAISAQLKTDKQDMEQPIPSYHGSLSFSSFHANTDTNLKRFDQTEKVNQHQKEQSLPESLKSGTSSQLPFVPSEDTSRSGGSSLEEQDFPRTVVPFSGGSEVSETIEPVSVLLPTKEVKQQTNSESTGPFEVSISAESVTPDSDLKGNVQTQDDNTSPQKGREEKDDDLTSTEDNTAEDYEKLSVPEETEELPLKTDEELRRSVETSLLSISNEFDSSTANLSNEELFAVEVLAQLAAAAKTPTHSPVKPAFSLQQASPRKGGTGNVGAKKSPMKVAVTGSTPYRLFSPGRLEPTIAAEVEVGSGCTPKKGSRQRKSAMDSPFIPPQQSELGSKRDKTYKKSTGKDSKKADEKKKRDRKDSKQSAEVLAIPEQDSKTKKTKGDKVPPQEVKPLRCSPRKPQGKTADAARLPKSSPRKSPRKPITVTPFNFGEEAAVTDIGQQKTEGILQENQTLTQHNHEEARKTSTSPSVARSSDHNTESASYCVWQSRQTPERERESTLTGLEQNSCPDRLPHDDVEDMPNMIVLSPKSNGFQTRLMKKTVPQSETSAHNRSEANKPSLVGKIGTTNNKQIINSTPATIQSDSKSNQKDLLTVPISSKKYDSQNLQQTECSKDSPGTTSPKVHDEQNTKETVPNDNLSKLIEKQPEQMVTSTSSPLHPPHKKPGTNLGEKPAPNQTTEYNSTGTPARQREEGGRVDLSTSKGDSKVVKAVEPMQTGETTESLAANASTEEKAPFGNHKMGRTEKSQTALSQEKQEVNIGKSTLGEEELDVAAKQGAQTSAKPQPQTSLSPDTDVEEEEMEEGECSTSDEEEEEIDTTVLLPCSTSEENAAHNSIETAASFNSDTSLPRPSTPTGLRQEMTLDQFSVLDPDDLRCQSAMSIDVRLIPSTPSGKMGPPSRGATPSGKDAAPTPGKSNPALPKTPAEKRQSGAFRQLFNSPPGGRFASTPAAERPKPPRFQLDMSVISTGKEEDSQCVHTPVIGETADKTRQNIRDSARKADTVKQCETVDIAVQDSSKLHTKDLKHLETDKMHRQTEKERKTSGEKKTCTLPGSGRVNTTIASSSKLPPPRRVASKTDAFRKHLADENLKKETEEAKKQQAESHQKIKSVRTPEKNMKRKDLDLSDFFPDVSSDEDDVSDGLGDQEEPMEAPPCESKVSLTNKETTARVEEVSSVRKQPVSSEAPWQQQAEETAKRNSVHMPSASPSAKVSLSPTSSVKQPMKQINTNSPASAVHQKDPMQGTHRSDRQASITFGKAVPGEDKASNNKTVTDTAMAEAGSSNTVTAPKGRSKDVCSVQSETGLAACHKQDAVPITVVISAGLSGAKAPMSTSLSPSQTTSLTNPPSSPMPSGVLPSAHADIQTLPNQPQHSLCTVNNPHGGAAFQQPLSKEQPATLPLHNISPEPCVPKSVIPTPLPSQVENVAIQGPMPPNSPADGIFRVPLPPVNREPPLHPANMSQPTPPVYVAERPVIKLNKFSYAAICALEANYGYEWLWPVKPQPQESLPAKQEPDFLPSTIGSQETKLFVTTSESNVAAHQPSPLHGQPFSASTQILQPVTGGERQAFSAITSSVAVGNPNQKSTRPGRDRTSGVVTSKVEGKTVKELLSKSRRQQGKVQQQTGVVTGVEAMNTRRNNQVFPGVPQAAVPPATGVFLPGVSQVVGGPQVPGVPQVPGMSHMTGVSQVPGVLPSTVGNTAQVLYSANRNIFDALSGERLGVSNTPVGPPVTGTPVLTSQQQNVRTGPTVVMPPTPNQQKLKQGTPCTTPKDVPPCSQTPDSKTCNKRITSPNPDIWYQAFGSPKAAAQNTEMYETQKTTAHKEKGTGEPKAVVKKCLEENHQEAGEGDLSEGEIVSDDEDVTIVKSSGTSSYRDSHCREKPSTGTSKRNEGTFARQNNSQRSEQRVKEDRNSHRSRGQKASDMKRDRKHTEHSRHGSRRPASEEVRLREQNYKEGWGRGDRGRTDHGRGEKVPWDRAPASWEGEQVSRKASKVERKARR